MTFKGVLHPYQVEPVERFIHRGSLLLAFAPGTGKTVIAIASAEFLMGEGYVDQVLVLCPASLKYQWADKIRQFTDSKVCVIDGSKKTRTDAYMYCRASRDAHVEYVVAGYDSVIYDYEDLSRLNPGMVICDEASAIKSFRTQRSKGVKKLFMDAPYKMAMTATPIENRPEELYSIMQWVDPSVLGRYDLFEKAYITRHRRGWVTAYKNLDILHARIGDAMARKARTDPDVAPYLPAADEENWEVQLTPEITKVYNIIADDMLDELANLDNWSDFDLTRYFTGTDESTPPGKLMAMHMCLEMLLDHPALIEWSAMQYEKEDSRNGSAYAYYLHKSGLLDNIIYSAKLRKLKQYVDDIMEYEDSKIIIFSKYKYMLQIIANYFGYDSVQFDGDMPPRMRARNVETFMTDPECRLFISSHAGGYGLDLPVADYLVNYDLPASFGAQDQLNSRHIRASSEFPLVYIRNLITKDTIEERNYRRLERKRKISELAIDGTGSDDAGTATVALDADYLRSHLEYFRRTH